MIALQNIKKIGTDITNIAVSSLSNNLINVAFIVINQYLGTRLSLGDAPMNDAINIATCFSKFGYTVYFMVDPKCSNFISKFNYLIQNTTNDLVFYYIGHGVIDNELNSNAFLFKDKNCDRYTLSSSISLAQRNDLRLVFISDCCYAGSIIDLDNGFHINSNIVTISSTNGR